VCSYRTEQRQAVRTVCEPVTYQQEVTVNVCSYRPEQREGTRVVCQTVAENVTRKVRTCRMVPYTEMVKVPVCVPVVSSCP
jgi:hypothetical protein